MISKQFFKFYEYHFYFFLIILLSKDVLGLPYPIILRDVGFSNINITIDIKL